MRCLPLVLLASAAALTPARADEGDGLRAIAVSPLVKVRTADRALASGRDRLRVCLARGEREPVQVVVVADRATAGLTLEVTPLTAAGEAGADASRLDVRVDRVGAVAIHEPSESAVRRTLRQEAHRLAERAGLALPERPRAPASWPDPLLPAAPVDLAPGGLQAFWLTVSAPRDAAAGRYRAQVEVRVAGRRVRALPLEVRVFDFALPVRPVLRTAVGLSAGSIFKAHHVPPAEREAALDRYRRALLDHRLTPTDLGRPRVEVHGQAVTIDWTAFDAAVLGYLARGATGFRLNWLRLPGGWRFAAEDVQSYRPRSLRAATEAYRQKVAERLDDPEQAAVLRALLRQTQEHLRAKGWLELAYVYTVDEPWALTFGTLRRLYAFVKEAAPELRILQTLHPPGTVTSTLLPCLPPAYAALRGVVDVWCPETDCVSPPFLRRAQARGEEAWTYVCIASQGRYGNMWAIDGPALEHRVLFWQLWNAGLTGFLYWNATSWSRADPWTDPMTFPGGNGDGSLFYPGPEGPLPSLRLAVVRDGVDDFGYLSRLRELVTACGGRAPAELLERGRALLDLSRLAPSFRRATRSVERLERQREAIGEAIEALAPFAPRNG